MKIKIIPVTPFAQNCSLLICEATQKAALVDPGGDIEKILDAIKDEGVTVEKILLTHGHLDHCGVSKQIRDQLNIPIEGPHIDDQFWIDQLEEQSKQFRLPHSSSFTPDRYLADDETVEFGNIKLRVKHCPGHTPGHVIFFSAQNNVAIVGDVLFAGSIGRTDFPRGDHDALIKAITTKLWPLGDNVTFIPGHGPTSTFGAERQTNPYVADSVTGFH
ncbi:MAG TPA: MBL fold metallo-hydrolase [Betaproteobacteria bacterium]|jgi:hydroxyacylglutathione hydrolase|nr:MBL fold metallo-hydrolase [Burkholderiales bacterium]HAU83549.1 MBL fold metallo-hydrolase [Betaproteobacteria bacterium]